MRTVLNEQPHVHPPGGRFHSSECRLLELAILAPRHERRSPSIGTDKADGFIRERVLRDDLGNEGIPFVSFLLRRGIRMWLTVKGLQASELRCDAVIEIPAGDCPPPPSAIKMAVTAVS